MKWNDHNKEVILHHALIAAKKTPYYKLGGIKLTTHKRISASQLIYYFKSMAKFREALLKEAIKQRDLHIIAQALTHKDPLTDGLDEETKRAALESFL
jgi:hypothetical protein